MGDQQPRRRGSRAGPPWSSCRASASRWLVGSSSSSTSGLGPQRRPDLPALPLARREGLPAGQRRRVEPEQAPEPLRLRPPPSPPGRAPAGRRAAPPAAGRGAPARARAGRSRGRPTVDSSPARRRRSVVLPAPFSPTRAVQPSPTRWRSAPERMGCESSKGEREPLEADGGHGCSWDRGRRRAPPAGTGRRRAGRRQEASIGQEQGLHRRTAGGAEAVPRAGAPAPPLRRAGPRAGAAPPRYIGAPMAAAPPPAGMVLAAGASARMDGRSSCWSWAASRCCAGRSGRRWREASRRWWWCWRRRAARAWAALDGLPCALTVNPDPPRGQGRRWRRAWPRCRPGPRRRWWRCRTCRG